MLLDAGTIPIVVTPNNHGASQGTSDVESSADAVLLRTQQDLAAGACAQPDLGKCPPGPTRELFRGRYILSASGL